MSAVSMKLKPAPTNASSSLNDVASSTVHPKMLPPNASGETCKPELPSFRASTLPPSRIQPSQRRCEGSGTYTLIEYSESSALAHAVDVSIPQGFRVDRH